jgi:hypothetical protein
LEVWMLVVFRRRRCSAACPAREVSPALWSDEAGESRRPKM